MKLLGKTVPHGPGGRDCACCAEPPGLKRKKERRAQKRREAQAFKKDLKDLKD